MDNDNEQVHEDLDFTNPTYAFTPRGNHEWRQQGPYLICKSCELEHAIYVGMAKRLVGFDEQGQPILVAV